MLGAGALGAARGAAALGAAAPALGAAALPEFDCCPKLAVAIGKISAIAAAVLKMLGLIMIYSICKTP
jgi:hypothetical protein